ncbi:electron transfer flavoprotein subunit beta/FixA family protein [Sphingobium chungbukense]|uniref:electron transfer flavoprotein subunit beta/FixA family protein n=1 Tax=Sphingobium chungbukense TaxID=56193 RepID=UPI00069B8758|nr:hypothetical protein [Sphingobium chungbukense]
MRIVVLIAGVLDPKWPVVPVPGGLPARSGDRLLLSPFDEAALELALKIRDARADIALSAVVAGGPEAERLARTVCALHVADVSTLALATPWDQAAVARTLALAASGADLILIGREFGDCDDGLIPPMLAAILGLPFFGRAQVVESNPALRLMREAGSHEEWVAVDRPIVASVTNDRRTRLRKPLMKNVMMARQAPIVHRNPVPVAATGLQLAGSAGLAGARSFTDCRMIDGDVGEQARALAAMLRDGRL